MLRRYELVLGFLVGMLFTATMAIGLPLQHSFIAGLDATALFTFGLVIVGATQVGLFIWQLRLIRESLIDAQETAHAGTVAANAANRQAKIAEESLTKLERPYLFVFNVSTLQVEEVDDEDGGTFLSVTYSVANYGKIPAIIKYAQAGLIISTKPESPPRLGNHHTLVVSPILPANDVRSGIRSAIGWLGDLAYDQDGDQYPDLGNRSLFFWVIIAYRGPFSDQHETRACWEYDSDTNRFIGPFGGPEFSGEK